MKKYFLIILSLILFSCGPGKEETDTPSFVSIENIDPLSNIDDFLPSDRTDENGVYCFSLDYDQASEGFTLPSGKQLEAGFNFQFELKNTSGTDQAISYAVFFQNESYKFNVSLETGEEHPYCHENFFGSLQEGESCFTEVKKMAQLASEKIDFRWHLFGNPRNQDYCFKDSINHRWRQNIRVGYYSILVVVMDTEAQENIPHWIHNRTFTDSAGVMHNPYHYFLYGQGKELAQCELIKLDSAFRVKALPPLSKGLSFAPGRFEDFCKKNPEAVERNKTIDAAFECFLHHIDPSTFMDNIPLIRDVAGDNYSEEEYQYYSNYFALEERVRILPNTSPDPYQWTYYDSSSQAIKIINPAAEWGSWKKQNVGIRSKHGLTYGKYTVKCNLSRLLSDDGVWNGLTNAIWLINQELDIWNHVRECEKEGYLSSYHGGNSDSRVPTVGYSEIDFEILKTVPYCPDYAFPPVFQGYSENIDDAENWLYPLPHNVNQDNGKICVACTNWDMACPGPEGFDAGCHPIVYNDTTFECHRWDNKYRALTQKRMEPDAILFGSEYYYFQIEWKPEEIIWRIGPEKDRMSVVGYMNSSVTSIPNNQMLLIVTQEFHNSRWWPGSPYEQHNVPFPEKDLVGEIYEVIIE